MYLFIKRIFDIVVSLLILAILSPLFIPIIIFLSLTGEGHVFYYQQRIGYKNRRFNIIKFATMLKNSPNLGTGYITLRNDPRLLPMGKFLRMTKINELPQLINVLKGDMSLVGPRPLVDRTFNAYSDHVQSIVYNSKPGITGIGSVIFRDEEKLISSSSIPVEQFYSLYVAPYKGSLELWYFKNRSFLIDIKILFLTCWVILFPNNSLIRKFFKDLPDKPKGTVVVSTTFKK